MLEATIVAVLAFVVWVAMGGGISLRPSTSGSHKKLKVSRLPFRFSLRTLLIAITLVAVVLGVLVATSR